MSETPPPERPASPSGPSPVVLGVVLVAAGAILLIGQTFDFGIGDVGWPIWIIAVGLAVLLVGLLVIGERGMVIGGTVVTALGLLLAYQNATGHWESWAYAWTIFPTASGLGLALWGIRSANGADLRNGTWGLLGGLGMFAVFFLFFEGVIGLSGERLPLADWVLPAVIIGIGVVLLVRGLLDRRPADIA